MSNNDDGGSISPATELQRRRRARTSLIGFAEFTLAKYKADPFHYKVAEKLEAVERGEIKRLMIFAPPRHGKSELSTRRFPAWYLGRNPTHNIISASYNAAFAKGFGRNVRDIVNQEEFGVLFPDARVRADLRAADEWELEQGGQYFSVGVGSGTTGRGANLFLIDDPIKDRKEADSKTFREDMWNWYRDVVYTRLEEDAPIILTLTRWHFDDIAGRLLELQKTGKGEPWEVLLLPALATPRKDPDTGKPILTEDGTVPGDPLNRKPFEPLSPSRFSYKALKDREEVLGERGWSALYQQNPISEEGGMFKSSWFGVADTLPARRQRVRAWDFGASIDGDWTVGVLMSRDSNGVFYIEDVRRLRGTPHEVEKLVSETARDDGKGVRIRIPQDPGQAGKAQKLNYMRLLAGYRVEAERISGDKKTRAEAFAAQAQGEMVKIYTGGVGGSHWRQVFLDELATFPLGTHDDQVDAAADAFNALLGRRKAGIADW
jgi:predicted phage terminase large subunit-like protein